MTIHPVGMSLKRFLALFGALTVTLMALAPASSSYEVQRFVSLIVQGVSGSADARAAVESVGGEVTRNLPIVRGVEAKVPAGSVPALERHARILQVTENARVGFQSDDFTLTPGRIGSITNSSRLVKEGVTGQGVTVALLDTGVYDHPDLAGRVVHCEDFSAENGTEAHCADTFGHGTFMAGLIGGDGSLSGGAFAGSAPGVNIVSLKMAGFDGASDVSTILAGIQWVVANKNAYNIKALNLSLGSDSSQSHLLSPLNYAVQKAWKSGITVVVSAGNSGSGSRTILKPADDPYVITVGASNDENTLAINDDRVPVFSSRGPTRADGLAKPDVVAPGVHTVSLRSPGSAIDQKFGSTAVVRNHYFRGTGTSMSAATVTGIVAQILQANPGLSPDQVKHRLMSTARRIADTAQYSAGKGVVDAYAAARSTSTQKANQYLLMGLSTGLGSIDGARGSLNIDVTTPGGISLLDGEYIAKYDDALLSVKNLLGLVPYTGVTYTLTGWDPLTWEGVSWKNGEWAGVSWKGVSWKQTTWDGVSWKGVSWKNADWEGVSWKNVNWDGVSWKATSFQSAWYAAAWD